MSYNFELIGITPVVKFLDYQELWLNSPHPSRAYLGSSRCTLDGFLQAAETITEVNSWDWDEVSKTMIQFWLRHEESVRYWRDQLGSVNKEKLLVARVASWEALRDEFESLLTD